MSVLAAGGRSAVSMATGRSLAWLLDQRATISGDHPYLIWEPHDAPCQTWTFAAFEPPTGYSEISSRTFRHVLGHFCTAATIITSMEEDCPVGVSCQSFSSPLILLCASATSTTWPRIRRPRTFSVNSPAEDQETLSHDFAVSDADKFASVRWQPSRSGIRFSTAYSRGSIQSGARDRIGRSRRGGRTGFRPGSERSDGRPLTFYRGACGRAI